MSLKDPLLEVVVSECESYPAQKVLPVTIVQPHRRIRQRVAARKCCVANRCFFLFFLIFIGSGIIFRPKSLHPSITSSDMYFKNGTISTDKTLDVWNPNYYNVEMKNPVLEQWYLSCDCDDVCGWELFEKYEYRGKIDIKSSERSQIITTSTIPPTPGALSYYAKRCLGDNLFIKFTSSWKSGNRKWKWYGAEYRIDCS